MAHLTAIEFSDDSCVLVRVATRGTSVEVVAAHVVDPAAFPGGGTFAAALRQARKAGKFPRQARVVLWGMPDGAGPRDPAVSPRLEPLISAGFKIDRVVSPCNALAALARTKRPKSDGVVWLAVDRGGVALIAARTGELMYSHAFDWDSSVGATGSQAHLLHRYALVSFLAPQVQRAMQVAVEKGRRVETIVTCGTLPDLRSLTMPLIEELDTEVETLDSLDGLIVKDSAKGRLSDMAAAIRIACAGAIARPTRSLLTVPVTAGGSIVWRVVGAIGAGAVVLAAVWFLISRRPPGPPSSPPPSANVTTSQPAQPPRPGSPPAGQTPAPTVAPSPGVRPQASEPGVRPQPAPIAPPAQPLLPAPARADKHRAEPLKEPLPVVNTILVSPTRRFATIDGRIVSVGDKVGQRTIVGIEPHFVVLREPSGAQIRVGLGGRRVTEGVGNR
jgi:hypothetical protein